MSDYETNTIEQEKPSLEEVKQAFETTTEAVVSPTILYGLSGLGDSEFSSVRKMWMAQKAGARRSVIRAMIEVSETNIELDYDMIAHIALDDPDPLVRKAAIELLWENETLNLMNRLIHLSVKDDSSVVRAEAAKALGRFILLGELGKIEEAYTQAAQNAALAILNNANETADVRRRALESFANCSHDLVASLIRDAYNSTEHDMRVSALYAMGRSCDKQWADIVLQEIENSDSEMRFEAARASGELEIEEAVPLLERLTQEDDREIKESAIWALGEIGGKQALRILNDLMDEAEETEDELLIEALEDAIGNASLTLGDFMVFDFDIDD